MCCKWGYLAGHGEAAFISSYFRTSLKMSAPMEKGGLEHIRWRCYKQILE